MRQGNSEFHPFWLSLPLVAAIVLVQTISRGLVAFDASLLPDEGYYTLWSFHPSAGYLDHPPLIAWLIGLGRFVVGENSLGVRLLAVIAPVIISLALYRTGTLLTDRASALLAVLWYNLSLGVALSLLATPDVPSTLFWMLTAWALAEFIAGRNANWWLLVGLFAGLGVLGKYTNLFLGAGIVLLILSGRARWQWLKLWQVWAGGTIALLVAAPNLLWNAQNGWATFVKQGGRIANDPPIGDIAANYLELLGAQALFLGPLIVLGFLVAIPVYVFGARRWPGLALPVLSGLPALVYFVVHASRARVEANWLLPLWPMMTLAAAYVIVAGLRSHLVLRIVRGVLVYLQTGFSLLLTGLLTWVVFAHPAGLEHLDRTRDMRGWTEVAQQLDAIADDRNAPWIGVPPDYGQVGLFAAYNRFIGSDRPVLSIGDRIRYRFDPIDPASLQFPAVYVGWTSDPASLAAEFSSVEPLGSIERKYGTEVRGTFYVFAVDQPTPAFFAAMQP